MNPIKLFGFEIKKIEDDFPPNELPVKRSFVSPEDEAAAKDYGGTNLSAFSAYHLDLDKSLSSQAALINEYRSTAMISDVDKAVENIVAESVITDENQQPVKIILDEVPLKDNVKQMFEQEFDYILKLLKFPGKAHDIFKRWYVDGQLNYHKLIDETMPEAGIQELRYVDPRNLMKIREFVDKQNDPQFAALKPEKFIEYWLYSESGFHNTPQMTTQNTSLVGIRIAKDSVAHCNSGLLDPSSKMIMSHLHKSVRIARQLRMLKDSMVIYRVTRSSEKRVFFIGVNGLPRGRQEQHMQSIIAKYKNRLSYDPNTGELRDERKHLSAVEDFFIPVVNGEPTTKIETLPGADNLGVTSDVEMFQKELYGSLNVPQSRLDPETMHVLGRSNEVTRDELMYSRFIARLRNRFAMMFEDLLGTQLTLKGILSKDEWDAIKADVHYDFLKDNFFAELMESEILMNRLNILNGIQPFVGTYYSTDWVKKNVLRQNDEDIEIMNEQMEFEMEQQLEAMEAQGALPAPEDENSGNDKQQNQKSPSSSIPKIKISKQKGTSFPKIEINSHLKEENKTEESLNDLLQSLTEETKKRTERLKNIRILPSREPDVDGSL